MNIIAHRGEWGIDLPAPNTMEAFQKALVSGFGIEVDIRDYGGELVISHNPSDSASPKLENLLSFYRDKRFSAPIALNVKADGLQTLLISLLQKYSIENYFTFDMSVPNTLADKKAGLSFYVRQSEYEAPSQETLPGLYAAASGVWVDQFEFNQNILEQNLASIKQHISFGKKICFVSTELHPWGKTIYKEAWQGLREIMADGACKNKIYLCTDFTHEARRFFNEQY